MILLFLLGILGVFILYFWVKFFISLVKLIYVKIQLRSANENQVDEVLKNRIIKNTQEYRKFEKGIDILNDELKAGG